jgi:hypothetical protein
MRPESELPPDPEQEFQPPRLVHWAWLRRRLQAQPLIYGPALLLVAILGIVFALHLNRSSSHSDSSAEVAALVGADSCSNSGYGFVSQITNKQTTIYDCAFASVGGFKGGMECVTYENGIATNDTDEVKLVFANALNGKPACISGA